MSLDDETTCCRYPTAGIDNMLHITSGPWSMLNYNDCNLPAKAIQSLRRHIGPLDLLFTNYNHAGKLFDVIDDDTMKAQLTEVLELTVEAMDPVRVIPFASNHYYRTEESADQNSSMLGFDDLDAIASADDRFVVPRIGDEVVFESPERATVHPRRPPLRHRVLETHDYGDSVPWDQLIEEASVRTEALGSQFLRLGRIGIPDLIVRVSDHDRDLQLSFGQPAREAGKGARPHIEAHSQAVRIWLARRFGDDTFVAGAHFRVVDGDTTAIERWALATLLEASHLDPQSCLEYLREPEGRRFLWNRREEIVATILGARFKAGRVRL
jgi:hypothetical protein